MPEPYRQFSMRPGYSELLPADLDDRRHWLLFTRWLVRTGRLSDWGIVAEAEVVAMAATRNHS